MFCYKLLEHQKMPEYLGSIEVDQRQTFIYQADTLREIVGASRLISRSVEHARSAVATHKNITLVWPVSGVIRAISPDLDQLASYLYDVKARLDKDGLTASVAILKRSGNYDDDLHGIAERTRSYKDGKSGSVSLATLPFFAPCGIQPLMAANRWQKSEELGDRRQLRSWQSIHREQFSRRKDVEFHWGLSMRERALPLDFADLIVSQSDSYISLLKADVDGLGKLLAKLKFEQLGRLIGETPEEAGRQFSTALNNRLREAVQHGFNKLVGDSGNTKYPFLPLMVAGDDLLIVCQRHVALDLAWEIGHHYEKLAEGDETLKKAFQVSGLPREEKLTLSFGLLFFKSGFPFDAAVEMAEELVRSAKKKRAELGTKDKGKIKEGCIDFHWLASSGRESVEQARAASEVLQSGPGLRRLYTRPWVLSEFYLYLSALRELQDFPRRKLKQLDSVLRLAGPLSDLAYKNWCAKLRKTEQQALERALAHLQWPDASCAWLPKAGEQVTSLLELELLLEISHIQSEATP